MPHIEDEPLLGLIAPVEVQAPPEAKIMYPDGVRFLNRSLGLATMTPDGYNRVLERIVPAATSLVERGAQALLVMGTSLTFFQGAAFNRDLTQQIAAASGKPVTTMSTALVEGLRSVGGHRLAVATAYNDDVNERLRRFLQEEGFEVRVVRGLGVEKVEDIKAVTDEGLFRFSVEVFESAPDSDALVVSCGGLRTLNLLQPLEERCGVPVVSSMPHALRAGVKLIGHTGRAPGYGKLLDLP